jgi:hypothetical protein
MVIAEINIYFPPPIKMKLVPASEVACQPSIVTIIPIPYTLRHTPCTLHSTLDT